MSLIMFKSNIIIHFFSCMRQFKCSNKLLLTGTPIQNDVSELWALLNLLMPNLFDKLEDFNAWFGIENFFESNDKIAVMAKNNEILDIMLKVNYQNFNQLMILNIVIPNLF